MVNKKGYKLGKAEVRRIKKANGGTRYICNAPFASMSIGINGYVSPCCYTQAFYAEDESFDRYPEQSLQDIWNGKNFRKFRKMIRKNTLPSECSICYDGIRNQQFDSLKMHMFDRLRPKKNQPVFLEITVDNTCNLECVMCSSMLSSKIAARENVKFPHSVNHAQFKKEMSEWIPDLQEVVFSGGEPFLSKIYFDLFREIVHKNPDCLISVNTNGNILTEEIKALMKKGRFHLNVSIDSLIKDRYEKIRKGGSFDKLQKHLLFFQEYAKMKGIPLSMPVCPLKYNFDEMGDMVRYCNENDIYFVVVHVFNAWDVALKYAGRNILEQALKIYERETFNPVNELQRQNVNIFYDFVADVKNWIQKMQYREDFLKKVSVDEESFDRDSKLLEQKVEQYFQKNNHPDKASHMLEEWRQRKILLFDKLPGYYKAEVFYKPIFAFNTNILGEYLLHLPIHEMAKIIMSYTHDEITEEI